MAIDGRTLAIVKKCKMHGGDCPCGLSCDAEQLLALQESKLQSELLEVQHRLRWIRHVPATVRPDWKQPERPGDDYVLTAYLDVDEWHPHWHRESDGDVIDITGDQAWPFVEKTAWEDDWKRIGFEVV